MLYFLNLDTGTCIHGFDEECVKVSKGVPVDDEYAGMESHEEEGEDVAASQRDGQVCA